MHEILCSDKAAVLGIRCIWRGLRPGLLQTREGKNSPGNEAPNTNILRTIAFTNESLSAAEKISNMQREALGILHSLEDIHHYCFARKLSMINDHKPLIAIFKKRCSYIITKIMMHTTQKS